MDKQTSISSSKYISSTLDNIVINSDISLSKMKEVITSLDKATKAIIIPILKIKKKISMKFDLFAKDYTDIKNKAELVNKELLTHSEDEINDTMNITDIQLNQRYALNHENMISFYQNISNNITLFTRLFNSNEYDNLIKGFEELIPDNEIFSEEDKIREKGEIKNIAKNTIRLKKPRRPLSRKKKGKKKKILKSLGPIQNILSKKNNNNNTTPTSHSGRQRRLRDFELLAILQKNYPSNSYIRKVSKTFISRRLNKKVIYRHVFEYKEDGSIKENKLRTAGETMVYKYGSFSFKFINDEIKKKDELNELMASNLKSQFSKIDTENKIYIIGGKIGLLALELINKVFRKNLYKDYSVVQVVVEFYEFYEELVNEFNEKINPTVKIINCDEITLKNLRSDFKNLQLVRNTIKQIKDSGL